MLDNCIRHLSSNPTKTPVQQGAFSFFRKEGIADRYGTHSVRKGVGTFACGGSTGGPSMVSVCLRCGWSIGGVQDRYLRYEAAGEQFLGRMFISELIPFAVLPPHFRDNTDDAVTASLQKMVPALVGEQNTKGVLLLCLASLGFRDQYFAAGFPPNHSLVSRFIFPNTDVLSELHKNLELGEPQWMRPTGTPPHVELYKNLEQQQQSIDALPGV
ncbi:LOW QUALITY PROTEIN: hypothetical protein PHMEG_00014284 [Phytophthora megakarya]|uniref:Uncharacterized protein n=1 Tax=Phytophthora megakarya TaxID=4795 RepID=A0A225W690_9STRA|nr:LOW QUALITY PROTEIN: hypothetical protein PHMEG_00014284 [Phytophthora megakarya]